jgi:hypothetical protein
MEVEAVGGANTGYAITGKAARLNPLADEITVENDLHFDGQTVKYELRPADDGHWMLRMYDDSGAVAWIHLPRGQAHDTAWHLAYRMEIRSYELPRYSA